MPPPRDRIAASKSARSTAPTQPVAHKAMHSAVNDNPDQRNGDATDFIA
ncbi:hypothetical protein Rhow_004266 [Rhodococcus wratislaviensis]|uniref:Uncharacterized protein n=1 Tax=Rhodococcus wratislaviensis TaxID=44752 RepID=A0A402CAM3_RHOWR|nr:hypothetical protein Rhow_004266 [Rhodococcus wratislaviensis]